MEIYNVLAPLVPFTSQIPTSPDPVTSQPWQRLRDLISGLERTDHNGTAWAMFMRPAEVWLSTQGTKVTVRVDWMDYAPLVDGLPETHYRIVVSRDGKSQNELRIRSTDEAVQIIAAALFP